MGDDGASIVVIHGLRFWWLAPSVLVRANYCENNKAVKEKLVKFGQVRSKATFLHLPVKPQIILCQVTPFKCSFPVRQT